MKHPSPETWLAYLYAENPESDADSRAAAEAHLSECAECRQQLHQWEATLGVLNQDRVPPLRTPVDVGAILPRPAGRVMTSFAERPSWPWALAAGVLLVAAFLIGRSLGPSRSELAEEMARTRAEWTREITEELRRARQRDVAELATVAANVAARGQRELATQLLARINEARQLDRREFVEVIDRLDQRRADEVMQLQDGFRALAERTGGAFRETDTRLNALVNAWPVRTSPAEP